MDTAAAGPSDEKEAESDREDRYTIASVSGCGNGETSDAMKGFKRMYPFDSCRGSKYRKTAEREKMRAREEVMVRLPTAATSTCAHNTNTDELIHGKKALDTFLNAFGVPIDSELSSYFYAILKGCNFDIRTACNKLIEAQNDIKELWESTSVNKSPNVYLLSSMPQSQSILHSGLNRFPSYNPFSQSAAGSATPGCSHGHLGHFFNSHLSHPTASLLSTSNMAAATALNYDISPERKRDVELSALKIATNFGKTDSPPSRQLEHLGQSSSSSQFLSTFSLSAAQGANSRTDSESHDET